MRTYPIKADCLKSHLADFPAGERVFVGFDVHAKTWSYCVQSRAGDVLLERKVDACWEQLDALAETLEDFDVHAAYEAGPTGFGLLSRMREYGWSAMVVPPTTVRSSRADRRVKNDRRDAQRITDELRSGKLWSIAELPAQQVRDRQLLRTAYALDRDRQDKVRQIRSLCLFHSLPSPWSQRKNPGALTKADRGWIKSGPAGDPSVDSALLVLLETAEFLEKKVAALWKQLEAIVLERYAEAYERLRAIEGIGLKTSVAWVLEVPPLERFDNSDAFVSWLGLAQTEHSSGESEKRGGVGGTGNGAVRRALIQVVLMVAAGDPSLNAFGKRLRPGLHAHQVKTAMAAKLARRLFQMMKRGVEYAPPPVADVEAA